MLILVPQGLGDSIWAVTKMQDLVKQQGGYNQKIDIKIAVWRKDAVESRAVLFLERFKFVNSVETYVMPKNKDSHGPVLLPGPATDDNGLYRYIPDGPHPELPGVDYVMIPNTPLERGIRLEDWLPGLKTNWDIMDDFQFTEDESRCADEGLWLSPSARDLCPSYVVFYMSALSGNTIAGHNRNAIWKPEDWIELGEKIHARCGAHIIMVGTAWDEDYFYKNIRLLTKDRPYWHNCLSRWSVPQTYAVLKRAKFVISYQSGIGIISHYLGIPVAIWWRAKGDSITPNCYTSFEEEMASAWARPDYIQNGLFMPCIYSRHGVKEVLDFADKHGWYDLDPYSR